MHRNTINRADIARAAIVSLALGTGTIGCTPSAQMGHPTALSDTNRGSATAAHAARKAHAALDAHNPVVAIRWAERAVAASPGNADHRMLLGQAYLSAGRFASAETAFRETLTLAPDQPRARFDLALAQIAQGTPDSARATLTAVRDRVPDADVALAMALAGDRKSAIAMLTGVVRTGQSDARTRQNLALALALDGQWGPARGMAMQDTPPDRLEAKLAGWATLAKADGARQVSMMLGTTPAIGDPGRPLQLALAVPETAAPTALALAPANSPLPAQPVPAGPPTVPASAMIAAVPSVPSPDAGVLPVPVPPVDAPVAASPAAPVPPRFVRVATAAFVHPSASLAPGPIFRPVGTGGFVVQLGAFARTSALNDAWAQASRLSPRLATFTPVQGSTRRLGATLMRLSIGGFADRDEARDLCLQVKAKGGACFVRATTGDHPWQWAGKTSGQQLAMR